MRWPGIDTASAGKGKSLSFYKIREVGGFKE